MPALDAEMTSMCAASITAIALTAFGLSLTACRSYSADPPPGQTDAGGAPRCRPRQILATKADVRSLAPDPSAPFSTPPTCRIDRQGAVVLEVAPPACRPENSWWAGCAFADHLDLRDFAARGQGVFAARVCATALPRAKINLRFGPPALSQALEIMDSDRDRPDETCTTVYMGRADACCNMGRSDQYCDGGVAIDAASETAQAALGPTCTDFQDTQLVLMAEWCQPSDIPRSTDATVRLESLIFYPRECGCEADTDCLYPNVCRDQGWPDRAACRADGGPCPAICTPGLSNL